VIDAYYSIVTFSDASTVNVVAAENAMNVDPASDATCVIATTVLRAR